MEAANAKFDGPIPENYDRHLGSLLFEPYALDLAARLNTQANADVLELACGTGILTRLLRQRLPDSARLVATDLNTPMLDYASAKLAGSEGIQWQQADACALPFPDGSFDAVVCQFGLMFVPDKPAAMSEIRRVLRANGSLVFSVWDSIELNDLARITQETVARLFPRNRPTFYDVPFSLHDRAALTELVTGAGFKDLELSIVSKTSDVPSSAEAAKGLVYGNPLITAIQEQDVVGVDTVVNEISQAILVECGTSPTRAKMQAIVITARSR